MRVERPLRERAVSPLPPQRRAHRQLPRLLRVGHTASQQVALRSLPRMAPPLHQHRVQLVRPNHRRQRTRLLPALHPASNHTQPPPPHTPHTRRHSRQPQRSATLPRRPDPQEASTTHHRRRAGHRPHRVAKALPDRCRPDRAVRLASTARPRHRWPSRAATDPRAGRRAPPRRRRSRRPAWLEHRTARQDLARDPHLARPARPARHPHRMERHPTPDPTRHQLGPVRCRGARHRRHAPRRPTSGAARLVHRPHQQPARPDPPRTRHLVRSPPRRFDQSAASQTTPPSHRQGPRHQRLADHPRLGRRRPPTRCARSPATTSPPRSTPTTTNARRSPPCEACSATSKPAS